MQSQLLQSQQPLMAGVASPLPPTIVQYQAPAMTAYRYENMKSKQMKVLGIIQIVCGSLAIALGFISPNLEGAGWFIFVGIWCGPFFVIAGGFALGAVKHKNMCMIVACMVLSIIATNMAVPLLFVAGLSVAVDADCVGDYFHSSSRCVGDTAPAGLTVNVVLVTSAVVELVVSIWQSAVCCSTVCCLTPRQPPTTMTSVQYAYSPVAGWQANIGTPAVNNVPMTYMMPASSGQPGSVAFMPQSNLMVAGPSAPLEPPGYSGACAPPPYTPTDDTADMKKTPIV